MADPLDSISIPDRGLLSDQIYELIKAMIKDSRLAPGEQLVESQLARRLQVSQAPVREALKRLGHEGLVRHARHQGSFVAEYSEEDARQAKVARVALESLAGRLACGRLDDDTRGALNGRIDAMRAAADDQDLTAFRELDFEFHRAVIQASGNVYLPLMWDILEPGLRATHVLGDPDFGGDWHDVADWHRSLVDVLDGADEDAASDSFRRHAEGIVESAS
ncbi:UNVERIFIED_CONTAM: GntR family transcriptional regulator [Microbacterium sp. SLM126]